jgi:ribosomal-protein-alanine N-acetyltransferase
MDRSLIILETERLWLRRLTLGDWDDLAAIYGDLEVMRHIGDGATRSRAAVLLKLQARIETEMRVGYGMWAMIERTSEILVGECGLFDWEIHGQRQIEIGYIVGRRHWGAGLATEAARAVRDYAFGVLGLERLIAVIGQDNEASKRVALKLGMTPDPNAPVLAPMVETYAINRETWKHLE